jgi:hypothetical protein
MWSRLAKAGETPVRIAAIITKSSILIGLFRLNVCIAPAAQNGVATIWPISVALLHLPRMAAAKETTLNEVGEMLTHVVEHMATKGEVADIKTEMMEQFEHVEKQFHALDGRLRDIASEIALIHCRVERLEELGASNAGFAKEIDRLLARVAAIEEHLGIDKKIAA